jgi:hypothetical protein
MESSKVPERKADRESESLGAFGIALTEQEISQFLIQKGVKRISVQSKGRTELEYPVLCVLPDSVRSDKGPYKQVQNRSERPCVARLENPRSYINGKVYNAGPIVYYTLSDGALVPIKQSYKVEAYNVSPDGIFDTADNLFPLGNAQLK